MPLFPVSIGSACRALKWREAHSLFFSRALADKQHTVESWRNSAQWTLSSLSEHLGTCTLNHKQASSHCTKGKTSKWKRNAWIISTVDFLEGVLFKCTDKHPYYRCCSSRPIRALSPPQTDPPTPSLLLLLLLYYTLKHKDTHYHTNLHPTVCLSLLSDSFRKRWVFSLDLHSHLVFLDFD